MALELKLQVKLAQKLILTARAPSPPVIPPAGPQRRKMNASWVAGTRGSHHRPSCQALASRTRRDDRQGLLFKRLAPHDPGRAE